MRFVQRSGQLEIKDLAKPQSGVALMAIFPVHSASFQVQALIYARHRYLFLACTLADNRKVGSPSTPVARGCH